MKRFQFSAAKLLALRKQEVFAAELVVAKAASEVASASAAVEQELLSIESLSTRIENNAAIGFTHISQTVIGIRQRLDIQRQRLSHKKEQFVQAQQHLLKTKTLHASLATLRDRQREQYLREHLGQQQAEVDSYAARKWLMQNRRDDV